MRRAIVTYFVLGLVILAVSACSGRQSDPADYAESYVNALVEKDADTLVTLSCADWEVDAVTQVDSLEAVEARVEGLACEQTGTDGDYALVLCEGSIVLTYDGEDRPIDLATRTFQLVQSGSDWLVCGYHE